MGRYRDNIESRLNEAAKRRIKQKRLVDLHNSKDRNMRYLVILFMIILAFVTLFFGWTGFTLFWLVVAFFLVKNKRVRILELIDEISKL